VKLISQPTSQKAGRANILAKITTPPPSSLPKSFVLLSAFMYFHFFARPKLPLRVFVAKQTPEPP